MQYDIVKRDFGIILTFYKFWVPPVKSNVDAFYFVSSLKLLFPIEILESCVLDYYEG